jgi:hypothetical protein
VDQEVAKTLSELELKLQELERELTTIGRGEAQVGEAQEGQPQAQPGQGPQEHARDERSGHTEEPRHDRRSQAHEHGHKPGRLVDEAVEGSDAERAIADGDGFGGPAVFGGEEVPSQAGAAGERDWTVEVRETAYGEIPTPPGPPGPPGGPMPVPPIPPPAPTPQPPPTTPPGPPPPTNPPGPQPPANPPGPPPPETPPGTLDVAALRSFRDRLASTMEALIDEYSRLVGTETQARQGQGG